MSKNVMNRAPRKPRILLTPEQKDAINKIMLELGTLATAADAKNKILAKLNLDLSVSKIAALRAELGLTVPLKDRHAPKMDGRKTNFLEKAGTSWGWYEGRKNASTVDNITAKRQSKL